ncbi:hypothetical protein [Chitinophaga pinensis]|uniref:Uncharacterized protein n=1 Tax=Chitinophaga pinensis TaxID=79329 RepID=A0A5C6LMX9_9BACT|nr:hypothetical protein [Chitinophaga pinensis]TWV98670.1 hypothetical protein FEF09_20530 [Chitinophaga pinensis]
MVRTEQGEEEGSSVSTVISEHLSSFVNAEAAQQVQQTYVTLFSGLWLTVSGGVTGVSAATYYFRDLDAPKIRLQYC